MLQRKLFEAAGDRLAGHAHPFHICLNTKMLHSIDPSLKSGRMRGAYELGRLSLSDTTQKACLHPCGSNEAFKFYKSIIIGSC